MYNQNNRNRYDENANPQTALQETHDRIIGKYLARQDEKKLIEEITQNVLERVFITLDVAQAVQEIEELKKQLESVVSILKKGGR